MSPKPQTKLRSGFTTGAAAAAAAKGALLCLLEGSPPTSVEIGIIGGGTLVINIHGCRLTGDDGAACTVVKDGGDDPDVTHKAVIGAAVRLTKATSANNPSHPSADDIILAGSDDWRIVLTGGIGVGRVTKPGLAVTPGEPAINPGPRRMIRQAVADVLADRPFAGTVRVEIHVVDGEALAEKTLNARLGILGGISILGTTGVVRPMSHDAYIATIRSALSVARAAGIESTVLTTGRRSERFAQRLWPQLPPETFVQIGDFFEASLLIAAELGFREIRLAVFFGKAVKMAQGIPHTHAAKSAMTLQKLSEWAFDLTGDRGFAGRVFQANTARHALDFIRFEHPALIDRVGRKMIGAARRFSGGGVHVRGVVFDFDGQLIFDATGDPLP